MQQWATDKSDQGPIYLGYRIGHVKRDSRLFRAVVYDKGAIVLHMLRRLLGDEAFFGGLRRFYNTWRFQKAGTDDVRLALEKESGLDLGRFFERWVYGEGLPQVAFTSRLEERDGVSEAVVRFEQSGEVYDFPVTVTLAYLDNTTTDVIVKVTDRVVETRVPVKGKLRKIDVNRDQAALGVFR
jgi:aminopeptidase N